MVINLVYNGVYLGELYMTAILWDCILQQIDEEWH